MILRNIVAARAVGRFALVVLAAVAATLPWSAKGLKLALTQQYAPVVLTIPELAGVAVAALAVVVLRTRLWSVDRMGTPGRRWVPSVLAVLVGLAGPQAAIGASLLAGTAPVDAVRASSNLLFLTGAAFVLGPFVGAFVASGGVLLAYFSLMCALQLEPAVLAWSPLAPEVAGGGRLVVAAGTGLLALLVHAHTLGRTRWTAGRDRDLA